MVLLLSLCACQPPPSPVTTTGDGFLLKAPCMRFSQLRILCFLFLGFEFNTQTKKKSKIDFEKQEKYFVLFKCPFFSFAGVVHIICNWCLLKVLKNKQKEMTWLNYLTKLSNKSAEVQKVYSSLTSSSSLNFRLGFVRRRKNLESFSKISVDWQTPKTPLEKLHLSLFSFILQFKLFMNKSHRS